jgi:hypothetical protein
MSMYSRILNRLAEQPLLSDFRKERRNAHVFERIRESMANPFSFNIDIVDAWRILLIGYNSPTKKGGTAMGKPQTWTEPQDKFYN